MNQNYNKKSKPLICHCKVDNQTGLQCIIWDYSCYCYCREQVHTTESTCRFYRTLSYWHGWHAACIIDDCVISPCKYGIVQAETAHFSHNLSVYLFQNQPANGWNDLNVYFYVAPGSIKWDSLLCCFNWRYLFFNFLRSIELLLISF